LPTTDLETDPIINSNVISSLYDMHTFCDKFSNSKQPIILSLNIQSLNAKYNNLCDLINHLSVKNVTVDIIALQETWQIKYCNLVCINNFVLKTEGPAEEGGSVFMFVMDLVIKYLTRLLIVSQTDYLNPFRYKYRTTLMPNVNSI
jgi:hypothetical protein